MTDQLEATCSVRSAIGSGGSLTGDLLRTQATSCGTSLLGSVAGAIAVSVSVLAAPPASGASVSYKGRSEGRHATHWIMEQATAAYAAEATENAPWKDQILRIKEQLQLAMADLARFAGVERPSVYHWLGGSRPRPAKQRRIDVLENVARIWSSQGLGPMGAYLTRTTAGSTETLEHLLTQNELRLDAIEFHVVALSEAAVPASRPRQSLSERLVARGFKPTGKETYRKQRAGIVRSTSTSGEE